MPGDSGIHIPSDIPPVGDFPELGQQLALVCGACGRKGNYHVGRVLINPIDMKSYTEGTGAFDEAVRFSGIFRCKQCGFGGPWEVPSKTRMKLLALLVLPIDEQGEFGVQFGELAMFDGTTARTGVEAEAYLKKKIEEQPESAFLWGRLGNFYEHAGFPEQARAAFEKSVQLDPAEAESLYSLGTYYRDDGDWKSAAECFEAAVRNARTHQHRSLEIMKRLVRSCLENLFELSNETGGKIRFPPKLELLENAEPTKPEDRGRLELDLPSEEGWEILTSIYLTGKVPEHTRQRVAQKRYQQIEAAEDNLPPSEFPDDGESGGGTIRGSQRVGRNDPCPCGSGKKYKKCCGKA